MGLLIRLRLLLSQRKSLLLAWRLLRDGRVPLSSKAIIPAALLYWLMPVDLLPDFFPGLGQLDDVSVIVAAVMMFLRLAPQNLVREHRDTMAGIKRPREKSAARRDEVIDGEYRILK